MHTYQTSTVPATYVAIVIKSRQNTDHYSNIVYVTNAYCCHYHGGTTLCIHKHHHATHRMYLQIHHHGSTLCILSCKQIHHHGNNVCILLCKHMHHHTQTTCTTGSASKYMQQWLFHGKRMMSTPPATISRIK